MQSKNNIYIYGRKPVLEAITNRADEIEKIFLRNTMESDAVKVFNTLAHENRIPVSMVPREKIERLVGRVNDQGVVAFLSTVRYTDFSTWIEYLDQRSNPAVLLLDGVEDPHNFGAILRTAAAVGMSAVLVPGKGQAPVSAAVYKTSAGTAGKIPIIRIHDTNQGIKDLTAAGFEIIALSSSAPKSIWELTISGPAAFLIGNEGAGISPSLLKKCHKTVSLPMENDVESLNASVTAALICYEWKRRRFS